MPSTILKAHYDGKQIVLDEPFALQEDMPLMVTVLAPDSERTEWLALSAQGLARAYNSDEPEYTTADVISQ